MVTNSDLWNDKEIIAYRQKIVDNDVSCCNSICGLMGTDAIRTKLGV